jgi:hypothetical protein
MRRLLTGFCAAAFVAALAVPALAATETVTGKLVDQGCYSKDNANNADNDHKMPADVAGCAVACAKKGLPVALLTSDGKIFTVAGGLAADNNAKLIAHMGHTVEITGDVMMKGDASTITAADLKMISR